MRTRRSDLSFAAFSLAFLFCVPAGADVLISEMCDPHLNYATDRFIEIYNAGANPVDLTGWSLIAVGNGGDIFTWSLSGSIAPGEARVAGDATTVIAFPVDFADENWSNSNGLWNGKVGDGARLLAPAGVLIDYAVVAGTAFENADYVRRPNVTHASTAYLAAEWSSTPVEYPTNGSPGAHVADPPPAGPIIENVRTSPALPLANDPVAVIADVRDTTAALQSVTLSWGPAPGLLANPIAMELVSGDTWQTLTPIPGQAAGTAVYFQVAATNTLLESRLSEILDYPLAYAVTIRQIQGESEESPYDNELVMTTGTVTAAFGSTFVIQDGGGAWEGLWVDGDSSPDIGDQLTIRGTVDDNSGNTLIIGAEILDDSPGGAGPSPSSLTTGVAATEPYEGVLVTIVEAPCTAIDEAGGGWTIDDGSGPLDVGRLGQAVAPTLGTRYGVSGPIGQAEAAFRIEPREAADVVWIGDDFAPMLAGILPESETSVRVTFSEAVEETSAETANHYAIPGLTVFSAQRSSFNGEQVILTVSTMIETTYTLQVSGVADLYGNVIAGAAQDFAYIDYGCPDGYYDPAAGLCGEDLQAALHAIIDGHTPRDYSFAWTAFYTTDDKPNGKVWDIYSDVPGGVPPYEYTFGVDQGGVGGQEGTGYSREHTWPKSWFGGEISPMYSDLFVLYPTDVHVNGTRGVYPYGEVDSPTWVSLNGSRLGPSSFPGYAGTVFEPIDAYKGDLARTYFYMGARYYGEDASWPGSPMTDGAQLQPWALEMLLEWHEADPVSVKERERNAAVFGFQSNRNPYIDRPEFVALVYETSAAIAEQSAAPQESGRPHVLSTTWASRAAGATLRFRLPAAGEISLDLCDISGRRVASLAAGLFPAGAAEVFWNGRLRDGSAAGSGIYFLLLQTPDDRATGRLLLLR